MKGQAILKQHTKDQYFEDWNDMHGMKLDGLKESRGYIQQHQVNIVPLEFLLWLLENAMGLFNFHKACFQF